MSVQPFAICLDGRVMIDEGGIYWPASDITIWARRQQLSRNPHPITVRCLAELNAAVEKAEADHSRIAA